MRAPRFIAPQIAPMMPVSSMNVSGNASQMRIKGEELGYPLISQSTLNDLNPANSCTFQPGSSTLPRLNQYASMFELYQIHSLLVQYKPSSGTNVSGAQMTAIDYGAGEAALTYTALQAVEPRMRTPVWGAGDVRGQRDKLQRKRWYETNSSGEITDLNPDDVSCIIRSSAPVRSGSAAAQVFGEVWIKYDISFSNPVLGTRKPTKCVLPDGEPCPVPSRSRVHPNSTYDEDIYGNPVSQTIPGVFPSTQEVKMCGTRRTDTKATEVAEPPATWTVANAIANPNLDPPTTLYILGAAGSSGSKVQMKGAMARTFEDGGSSSIDTLTPFEVSFEPGTYALNLTGWTGTFFDPDDWITKLRVFGAKPPTGAASIEDTLESDELGRLDPGANPAILTTNRITFVFEDKKTIFLSSEGDKETLLGMKFELRGNNELFASPYSNFQFTYLGVPNVDPVVCPPGCIPVRGLDYCGCSRVPGMP